MSLFTLFVVSAGAFALLKYLIVPSAETQLVGESRVSVLVAKTGVVGALKALQNVAAAGAIVALLFAGFVWSIGSSGLIRLVDLEAALAVVARTAALFGLVNDAVSWTLLVLSVAALVYLARRQSRLRMDQLIAAEVTRLREAFDRGEWEQLPPTVSMQELLIKVETLHKEAERASSAGATERAQQLERLCHELLAALTVLDWQRRMVLDFSRLEAPEPTTRAGKLAAAVFSRGTFSIGADFGRMTARATAGLALLALIGVGSGVAGKALDREWVSLSDIAIKNDKDRLIEALEATPDEGDSTIADDLARQFEIAFANAAVPVSSQPAHATVEALRRNHVRKQILIEALRSRTDVRAVKVQTSASTMDARYAKAAERAATRKPETAIGKSVAEELKQSKLRKSSVWQRITAELRARNASRPPSAYDLGGDVFAEVADIAMGSSPEPDSELGKAARKIAREVGKTALAKAYEIRKNAYLAELARTGEVQAAIRKVIEGDPRYRAHTAADVAAFRASVGDLPGVAPWMERAATHTAAAAGVDSFAEERATVLAKQLVTSPERVEQLALAFRVYDDIYPWQPSGGSARERFLDTLQRTEKVQIASKAASTLQVARADTARRSQSARNVDWATTLVDTGGIVVGRDPRSVSASVTGIRWREAGADDVELFLTVNGKETSVGRFSKEIVNLALAYAADGRPSAVTIVNVALGPTGEQKIALHPVLRNTRTGREIIAADNLIYDTLEANAPLKARLDALRARNDAALDLYSIAWISRLRNVLEDAQWQEARRATRIRHRDPLSAIARATATDAFDEPTLLINSKASAFDATLWRLARDCAKTDAQSVQTLSDCVAAQTNIGIDPSWQRRTVAHERSGIHDTSYDIAADGAWINGRDPFTDLHFAVVVGFDSANVDQAGSKQYEYSLVETPLVDALRRSAQRDSSVSRSLVTLHQFVRVQRLFRSALTGAFGEQFPIEQLVPLARATAPAVRYVPTPQWHFGKSSIETRLASVITRANQLADATAARDLRNAAMPLLQRCRAVTTSPSARTTSAADWNAACDLWPMHRRADQWCAKEDAFACSVKLAAELAVARDLRESLTSRN